MRGQVGVKGGQAVGIRIERDGGRRQRCLSGGSGQLRRQLLLARAQGIALLHGKSGQRQAGRADGTGPAQHAPQTRGFPRQARRHMQLQARAGHGRAGF
ncbi:hypothetical protein D3C87_955110 [compost metagenome]